MPINLLKLKLLYSNPFQNASMPNERISSNFGRVIFYPTLTPNILNRFSPFFTRSRAIRRALNVCIRKTIVHFVSEHQNEEWRRSISPKINCLPQQRPLNYCETDVSFIICMHASTLAETLVKIGSVVVEIFGEIGRFLPYRFKSTNFSHINVWHYWTKVHHICTWCSGIICTFHLLIHIAIFNSILKCQGAEWRSLCKFCPKLVAIATSPKE